MLCLALAVSNSSWCAAALLAITPFAFMVVIHIHDNVDLIYLRSPIDQHLFVQLPRLQWWHPLPMLQSLPAAESSPALLNASAATHRATTRAESRSRPQCRCYIVASPPSRPSSSHCRMAELTSAALSSSGQLEG